MTDETVEQRQGDADARRTIARLATETLPRLIERLARSELGELEVRDDGWRIRLRRGSAPGSAGARASQAPSRSTTERSRHAASGAAHPDRHGPSRGAIPTRRPDHDRGLVTSPAVGYFVAREGLGAGANVSSGDVLGQVDVLGVAQEIVAPIDGVLADFEVQPGQAIEYGQPVARITTAA